MSEIIPDQTSEWVLWSDRRPTDHAAQYRWRVSEREILGLKMRPEWTKKLSFCGMGYSDPEWWPPFSRWNGYQRSVDPSLEWRSAGDDEGEDDIEWSGLDLLPSPFTGKNPTVIYLGRYIGAPPYQPEWIGIRSYLVNSLGWNSAAKMRDTWNRRSTEPRP